MKILPETRGKANGEEELIRDARGESHPENAKYRNKVLAKKLRPVDNAGDVDPWTSRRRSAEMCVTIIGNNANRPPPFYSQPEHFQGVTAHSTSPHTIESSIPHKKPEQSKNRFPAQTQTKLRIPTQTNLTFSPNNRINISPCNSERTNASKPAHKQTNFAVLTAAKK